MNLQTLSKKHIFKRNHVNMFFHCQTTLAGDHSFGDVVATSILLFLHHHPVAKNSSVLNGES
jgi:hypothetical protein